MDSQDDLQRFRPFLRALADELLYSELRKKVDPSDLVQQTMLQAIDARSQFKGESDRAKAGWLRAILQNVVNGLLRRYRSDRRDIALEQTLDRSFQSGRGVELQDSIASPSYGVHMNEERLRIQETLALLSDEQRRAIAMRYWQDMSIEEIAQAMDRSPDAVASLIYRGMKVLRSKLV